MQKLPEYAEKFLEENRKETIDLLLEYARIPAYSFKEEKRRDFIKNYLENLGAEDMYVDEVGNLVCPIGCMEDSTDICVMAAHMDTVYPDETPLPVTINDEGLMVGPGVGDNSSSVASLLRAHEIILRNHLKPKVPVIILYDVCEEAAGAQRGMRHFVEKYAGRIKEVICIDADYTHTFDTLMAGRSYHVKLKGEQGFAYIDKPYHSAITLVNDFINRVYAIKMPTEHKTVHCVSQVTGTIAEASFTYFIRSQDWPSVQQVDAQFQRIVEQFRSAGEQVDIEVTRSFEGCDPVDTSELKHRVEEVYAMFGLSPITWLPSSGDIAPPQMAGIPAVGIGSAHSGPGHRRDEWLDTRFVETGAKMIATLLLDYFKA